jgi:hypothetical protein
MSCTAAEERLAAAALLEGRRGLEADIGEKRLAYRLSFLTFIIIAASFE